MKLLKYLNNAPALEPTLSLKVVVKDLLPVA